MVLLSAFILSFKGSQWSLYYALGIYVIRELAASILIMWVRYVELLQGASHDSDDSVVDH